MDSLVPVILCGGAGTRLWPVSTSEQPKQFHALLDSRSLFQNTFLRAARIRSSNPPLVICGASGVATVREQLRHISGHADAVIVEPRGRNTAPAIAAAARLAMQRSGPGDAPVLAVLSADHVFLDTSAFIEAVDVAYEAAKSGSLVVFGVPPTHPETGYGYIRKGEDCGRWSAVDEFVEKPDLPTAQAYLRSGRYTWNSGMFVFQAKRFLEELARFAPEILECVDESVETATSSDEAVILGDRFVEAPAISIDNAVMERTRSAVVVPLDAGWSDIGSWTAVHELSDKDAQENATHGDVVLSDAAGNLVFSQSRRVSVVGARNLAVIETPDEVLVLSMDHAQSLKQHVELINELTAKKK